MGEVQIAVGAATKSDVPETSAMMARAFQDVPSMTWLIPDASDRRRRLPVLFATALRHMALPHGGVEVARIDGRVVGAALWLPPGEWRGTLREGLTGLPGALRSYGKRIRVASAVASAQLRAHPRDEPHWYLSSLGVDPSAQGRGVGGALLRSRLGRCDAEGLPAYVETSDASLVPMYEHFGFEVTGELALPAGAPPFPTLWRRPRVW